MSEGKYRFTPVTVITFGGAFQVDCNAIAYLYDGKTSPSKEFDIVKLISFVAPATSCKSFAMSLRMAKSLGEIALRGIDGTFRRSIVCADPLGYTVERWKIPGSPHWHFVMRSKDPRLMTCNCDENLWQALRSAEITTPVLRAWVPYIREKLSMRRIPKFGCNGITKLDGFQCECALLAADTEVIDEIVSDGLASRKLIISSSGVA